MHNCHLLLLVHSEIYDPVMLSQFVRINHIDPDHCCVQPKVRNLDQSAMILQSQICLPQLVVLVYLVASLDEFGEDIRALNIPTVYITPVISVLHFIR